MDSCSNHLIHNYRFKEAVLAEAIKDQQEQNISKLKNFENERRKKTLILKKAIEFNESMQQEDFLDMTMRRAEEHRREMQVEKLRREMRAVQREDTKKKISLPYSPQGPLGGNTPHFKNYHSQQTSPKATNRVNGAESTKYKTSSLSTAPDEPGAGIKEFTSQSENGALSSLRSSVHNGNNTPVAKQIQIKAVKNGKIGPNFNHTIVTGVLPQSLQSSSGYDGFESLKTKRLRIVELKKQEFLKPQNRIAASIANYIDSPESSVVLQAYEPKIEVKNKTYAKYNALKERQSNFMKEYEISGEGLPNKRGQSMFQPNQATLREQPTQSGSMDTRKFSRPDTPSQINQPQVHDFNQLAASLKRKNSSALDHQEEGPFKQQPTTKLSLPINFQYNDNQLKSPQRKETNPLSPFAGSTLYSEKTQVEEAQRSFFNNKLKQKACVEGATSTKKATYAFSQQFNQAQTGDFGQMADVSRNSPKEMRQNTSDSDNYVMKLFPEELENKKEFRDFNEIKYAQLKSLQDKDPLSIMKTPKQHRTMKDFQRMAIFFQEFEFLRYQQPSDLFYQDLFSLCNLCIFYHPSELPNKSNDHSVNPTPKSSTNDILSETPRSSKQFISPKRTFSRFRVTPITPSQQPISESQPEPSVLNSQIHLSYLTFVLSGAILAKDRVTKEILHRYGPGSVIVNEHVIDTKKYLISAPVEQQLLENSSTAHRGGHHHHGRYFEVEKGACSEAITVPNKDYFRLIEDFRRNRNMRICNFIQDKCEGLVFRQREKQWFDMFLRNMTIKILKRNDIVYNEFTCPEYFYIIHTGILSVIKQVEVQYSNLWPIDKKEWTHMQRTQHVTKILQHITPGMYFGEEQVLQQKTVPCRVVVHSKRAVLLGFKKEALEFHLDTKTRNEWLKNFIKVRFLHEEEVRHETIIQWKVKSIQDHAFIDGLQGAYVNEGQRDAYLDWQTRRRQNKLKPWFEAVAKKQQVRLKSIQPATKSQKTKAQQASEIQRPNTDLQFSVNKDLPNFQDVENIDSFSESVSIPAIQEEELALEIQTPEFVDNSGGLLLPQYIEDQTHDSNRPMSSLGRFRDCAPFTVIAEEVNQNDFVELITKKKDFYTKEMAEQIMKRAFDYSQKKQSKLVLSRKQLIAIEEQEAHML